MNTDDLRYFLTLAEELNFGRAAERLGLSQSNLSGKIKKLEQEIGARLFERSTRHVRLTDTGVRALPIATRIRDQSAQLLAIARHDTQTDTQTIVIGDGSQAFSDGTARKLRMHASLDGAPRMRVEPTPNKGWVAGLIDGNADVVFLHSVPRDEPMIRYELASHCPFVCAVHPESAFAALPAVSAAVLENEALIVPSEARIGPARKALLSALQDQTPPAKIIDADHDWSTILELVACGLGIAFVPKSLEVITGATLRFVPLEGGPAIQTHYIAWRSDETRLHVLQFVERALKHQVSLPQ